jgi:cellulose biosynthesis protein BcsQ
MAKIVCVDKSTALRVELKNLIDQCFGACRNSIGYVESNRTVPASRDEVLLKSSPDVVVLGPGYSPDDLSAVSRQIREIHPKVPILIVLEPTNYTLRVLRRLEHSLVEVVKTEDEPVRIVHLLDALAKRNTKGPQGKLITISGVKGGVGATSLVSGLAHAAETFGQTAVVMDLSRQNAFAFYVGADRWQSPEYRFLLMEGRSPDIGDVEPMILQAPNGISIVLSPAGGADVRELFLRDPNRFEISLGVVDILRDKFDLVIVDVGMVEGLLPFALTTNADTRLVVSSTDPASVHLLRTAVKDLIEGPGNGRNLIVINEINSQGICADDIVDFVLQQDGAEKNLLFSPTLGTDPKAGAWIGTGNSFFTESQGSTQKCLEQILSLSLVSENADTYNFPQVHSWEFGLGKVLGRPRNPQRLLTPVKCLPEKVFSQEASSEVPLSAKIRSLKPRNGAWRKQKREQQVLGKLDANGLVGASQALFKSASVVECRKGKEE